MNFVRDSKYNSSSKFRGLKEIIESPQNRRHFGLAFAQRKAIDAVVCGEGMPCKDPSPGLS